MMELWDLRNSLTISYPLFPLLVSVVVIVLKKTKKLEILIPIRAI